MAFNNFGEVLIQALQAGEQAKRRRDLDAQEDEERKLRIDAFKHQQRELELEGRYKAFSRSREGVKEAAGAMEGRPLDELVQRMTMGQFASPEQGELPARGLDVTTIPTAPGAPPAPINRRQFQIPGSDEFGIPGYTQTPTSLEEIIGAQTAAKMRDVSLTPQKVGPGETVTLPATGQTIATGGPAAEPTVTIQTVDARGNPITRVLPRSEAAGQAFPAQPPQRDPVAQELARVRLDAARDTATSGGDAGTRALAEMAASNPSVLQGLTPTETGRVRKILALDPALRQQFDAARMAGIREPASRVLTALDDLIAPDANGEWRLTDGARALYGIGPGRILSLRPGSAGANARAALNQVTGNLTLDLIGQMKAQSRTGATGFGQLSERELGVIESAATVLKGEISESRALQELVTMRERFDKVMQDGSAEADPLGIR